MLLASSAEAFVAREAVMADVSASSDAVALAELSAKVGFPYTAGDAASSAGGACGYLITKIGPFNSAYEELADNHFANGESVCEDALLLPFTRMTSYPLPLHLSRRLRFSSASSPLLPFAVFGSGKDTAGLISCERSEACFGAWGRPFIFHARKLVGMGRDEEARDKARAALELPLWTLEATISTTQSRRRAQTQRRSWRSCG